ncbi:MAG: PAS domain S-box protein [Cryomorphaceae bacterium]|nr:PAS domain S-box protein [Flavobacteriales bacterium]
MHHRDHPLNILVVEDNRGDFLLIQDHLRESLPECIVTGSSTYEEACDQLSKNSFSIVLLDLSLPDKSGKELVKEISARVTSAPVIVLTGLSDKDFGAKAIQLGAADYLEKEELSPAYLLKSITYNLERKKITARLEESEKEYRDLFNMSPIAMYVYDLETLKFLQVNEAAVNHYGYSEHEFLGMTIKEIRPKSEIPRLLKSMEFLRSKDVWHGKSEHKHQKKNGDLIDVLIEGSIINYAGRKAELVHAIDITEKKRNAQALESAYSRLQKAESIAKLGYWERDLKTNKLFWSDEFYTITELENDDGPADFDKFLALIHNEDMEVFISGYRSLRTGLHSMDIEHRIVCRGGAVKFIRQKGNIVRSTEGEPLRVEGIIQDITDKKADELKLLLRESVIATTKEAVMITESFAAEPFKDRAVFINSAFSRITGYHPEDIIGKSSEILLQGQEDDIAINQFRKAKKSFEPLEIELPTVNKAGKKYWMSFSMSPVPDANGEYTHWLIIMRDITERRDYVHLLQRQNKRFKEIAFTQSHVVRAPLSRLMGLVNLLRKSGKDDPDFEALLQNVHLSANDLDEVIRRIVGKTKMDELS